jgi:cyclopropane fatty-acyl-phospholipid synthase-like methyltransferase
MLLATGDAGAKFSGITRIEGISTVIKYGLAAAALKAASINDTTAKLYRQIGNALGGKKRENTDLGIYLDRANLLLDLYRKYDRPQPGDRFLELGTGWMHFYAVFLRLFIDARMVTLDMWDNRQIGAFRACFARLRSMLTDPQAISTIDRVLQAQSFDELYRILDMQHVIVPDGSLDQFPDGSLASVFSMHVLEHVPREVAPQLVRSIHRVLKPGRLTVHQIGIDDHLAHYDTTVNEKQYITYSEKTWSRWFANRVQGINRLQMSDWLRAFEQAGFELVEKITLSTQLDGLRIAPQWAQYSREDLAVTNLTVVMRKRDGSHNSAR